MRKIILMAALTVILGSCMDDIYPGTFGPEKMLGMEAELYTTDTLHTVMLYLSGYESIEYAEGATVSIYVNGELQDVTSVSRPYNEKYDNYQAYPSLYEVRAHVASGDMVKIVADMGEYHAEAEAEALESPSIGKVGYLAGKEVDPMTAAESVYLEYRVEALDSSDGTDYYAIDVFNKKICINDESGDVVEDVHDRLILDVSKEPLMTSFFPSSFDRLSVSTFKSYDNFKYLSFADNSFQDGSYTLCLRNRDKWSVLPRHRISSSGQIDENGVYVETSLHYTMTLSAEVRLSHVSREVYSRFMAKSFDSSVLRSMLLFASTHEYPSNVKGGIGMVNVFSSDIREIEIGTFHYDFWNYHQIEDIFNNRNPER